ncbi:hypothetical protein CPB84DRAFT_1759632 [Gymnopilus junonius]|uniref:Uncharacterized protein n=1 Tax=Gymnopilus junonius TaxID=109634 RepID=A0A9P5P2P5_GYMJU|nr:hypothetical protein CPB84DRAFT_1759632 [Gymnopilus junonius]
MYIIETTSNDQSMSASYGDRKSAHNVLALYRNRNAILRKALQYPPLANNVATNSTYQSPKPT